MLQALQRPPRVLFVDDERNQLRVYQRALRNLEVVVAHGGVEAREHLQAEGAIDAVVCDLLMPGLSGAELYDLAVRLRPDLQGRFLFVTSAPDHPVVA